MAGESKSREPKVSRSRAGLVVAAATALTLAACTTGHKQGPPPVPSERPSPTVSPSALPRVLGLTATRLVFDSNRNGNYQIYQRDLRTDKQVALTGPGYNSMNPEPSPDGKSLVFYSDESGSNQVHVLNLQRPGSDVQLTHTTGGVNAYDPTYSTDGKRILFKESNNHGALGDLYIMNADGSGQRRVPTPLISRGLEGWKPVSIKDDEALITIRHTPGDAFSDNIYHDDTQTGALTPLVKNSQSNWYPAYSPQADRVVFIHKDPGQDVLQTVNLQGADQKTIVNMPGDNNDPSWSPDGNWVTFISNGSGQYDVYVVGANGGTPQLLDVSPPGSDDLSPLLLP